MNELIVIHAGGRGSLCEVFFLREGGIGIGFDDVDAALCGEPHVDAAVVAQAQRRVDLHRGVAEAARDPEIARELKTLEREFQTADREIWPE